MMVTGCLTLRKESAAGLKVTPLIGDSAMIRMFDRRSTRRAGATAMMATTWWEFTKERATGSTALKHSSAVKWKNLVGVCICGFNCFSCSL